MFFSSSKNIYVEEKKLNEGKKLAINFAMMTAFKDELIKSILIKLRNKNVLLTIFFNS